MQNVKNFGKSFIVRILENQTSRLRKKHSFDLVVVVGSVGKTSTKLSIAKMLSVTKAVQYQQGNYNDRLTVPLIFFGHQNPSVLNVFSWIKIFISNELQILKKYPYEVVVAELGTDGPNQIKDFEYLNPEIAVVTAVTLEHMEFFSSLDEVADEEMSVSKFSNQLIVNNDDIDKKYLNDLQFISYGLGTADYKGITKPTKNGQKLRIISKNLGIETEIELLGKQGAKVALASAAVASEVGLGKDKIIAGLKSLKAFNGRMKILRGIKNSIIIDDSYNASPSAVIAGLEVVYLMSAPSKIAILGSMNELGKFSESAHRQVGQFCNPKELDLVVTIGEEAEKYTAEEAKKNGCQVESFDSPFDAGDFVRDNVKTGSVIFAKGSQNRVFAEESLKVLLNEPSDKKHLVRQSKFWLDVKEKQFGRRI